MVLELIALILTIQYHSYNKSKFINSANNVAGGWYNSFSSFKSYLYLRSENKILANENRYFRNYIKQNQTNYFAFKDSISVLNKQKYIYASAEIINNDFHKNNNYITINKGEKDSVVVDMAVISPLGIVGVITNTSKNYATAISVLNSNFRTNAKIKHRDYYGTITWDGNNKQIVQLEDVPRQAILKVGDTIVTGGRSAIFPKDTPIGTVNSVVYKENNGYQKIDVALFNDITQITQIYLIKNLDQLEIKALEKQTYE